MGKYKYRLGDVVLFVNEAGYVTRHMSARCSQTVPEGDTFIITDRFIGALSGQPCYKVGSDDGFWYEDELILANDDNIYENIYDLIEELSILYT